MRRLAHSTLGVQKFALIGEIYSDFHQGEAVMTCDGIPGHITAVLDGPFPTTELYEVTLDNNAGGGKYTASQLRSLSTRTAALEDIAPIEAATLHLASDDYAELTDILRDRPPKEREPYLFHRTAVANNEPFSNEDSQDDLNSTVSGTDDINPQRTKLENAQELERPAVEQIDPPSACSFCGCPNFEDPTNTGRGTRMRCSQCGGTMTSWGGQWQPDLTGSPENAASRSGDSRAVINDLSAVHSSLDTDFKWHFTATWADVRQKAKRIKDSGGVRILAASGHGVTGEVQGDHHLYESAFTYVPGTRALADKTCGCKWMAYAWGRSAAYKRFEGRSCSHLLALQFEAQARGMFGKTVEHDTSRLPGQHPHTPVTVQYVRPTDRAKGKNVNRRSVPPGNMRSTWTGDSRVRIKGSLNSPDELPLPMGQTPIPDDHIRLYHYTHRDNLQSIREHGLLESHARGDSGRGVESNNNDPSVGIWASTHHPVGDADLHGPHNGDDKAVVEFHAHPSQVSYRASHFRDEDPHKWADEDSHHVIMHGDISPNQIAAIHEPWHGSARYMQESKNPKEEYSWLDDPGSLTDLPDYQKAWDHIKRHGSLDEDLSPIQVMAVQMVRAGDDVDTIMTVMSRYGVDLSKAASLTAWAAGKASDDPDDDPDDDDDDDNKDDDSKEVTADPMGGAAEPGTDIPRLEDRDQSDARDDKDKRHDLHHTNDARQHAPEFGKGLKGIPNLTWCSQCNGSGCGACSGTGQVTQTAQGQTVAPVGGQNDDAGTSIAGDGLPTTSSYHTATYTSDSLMPGLPAQTYQAPTYHSNSPNPGSTGWAASEDPHGWVHPLIGNDFGSFHDTASLKGTSFDPPTVSGVALKANSTGRVLMLQRSLDDKKDPARGTHEFPGGHHEKGDLTSLHAGVREWEEEVGHPFPEGGHLTGVHRSGPYLLHTVVVPDESQPNFAEGRSVDNPDGDRHEQAMWWDPSHAQKNPALRQELKGSPVWGQIQKAAIANSMDVLDPNDPQKDFASRYPEGLHRVPVHHIYAIRDPEAVDSTERDVDLSNGVREPLQVAVLHGWANLEDGHHRLHSAIRQGITHLPVQVTKYATLNDSPEPALPSTDGADDKPQTTFDNLIGSPAEIPPGTLLSTSPPTPWGYTPGDPNLGPQGQPEAPERAPADYVGDTNRSTDGAGITRPFQAEGSIEDVIVAFQLTAGAKAMKVEEDTSGGEIAQAAQAYLAKTAAKDFSFAEQQELIGEGGGKTRARNLDKMSLAGTHYENMPDDEENDNWFL